MINKLKMVVLNDIPIFKSKFLILTNISPLDINDTIIPKELILLIGQYLFEISTYMKINGNYDDFDPDSEYVKKHFVIYQDNCKTPDDHKKYIKDCRCIHITTFENINERFRYRDDITGRYSYWGTENIDPNKPITEDALSYRSHYNRIFIDYDGIIHIYPMLTTLVYIMDDEYDQITKDLRLYYGYNHMEGSPFFEMRYHQ